MSRITTHLKCMIITKLNNVIYNVNHSKYSSIYAVGMNYLETSKNAIFPLYVTMKSDTVEISTTSMVLLHMTNNKQLGLKMTVSKAEIC